MKRLLIIVAFFLWGQMIHIKFSLPKQLVWMNDSIFILISGEAIITLNLVSTPEFWESDGQGYGGRWCRGASSVYGKYQI